MCDCLKSFFHPTMVFSNPGKQKFFTKLLACDLCLNCLRVVSPLILWIISVLVNILFLIETARRIQFASPKRLMRGPLVARVGNV